MSRYVNWTENIRSLDFISEIKKWDIQDDLVKKWCFLSLFYKAINRKQINNPWKFKHSLDLCFIYFV